jgi:hypothetical protein
LASRNAGAAGPGDCTAGGVGDPGADVDADADTDAARAVADPVADEGWVGRETVAVELAVAVAVA